MMHGSNNENRFISSVANMKYVKAVFTVGLIEINDRPELACLPDGVALIDFQKFEALEWSPSNIVEYEANEFAMATIEMKKIVSDNIPAIFGVY